MTWLQSPALVLNKNWEAINVASAAESISMMCREAAYAVNTQTYELMDWEAWSSLLENKFQPEPHDRFIKAVRFEVLVPEVLVLRTFDSLPATPVKYSRSNVFKRDGYRCQFCRSKPGHERLTIDHVVPRAQGGQSTWDNCVSACFGCNAQKRDRTPEQAGMPLRKRPVRPDWQPLYTNHPDRRPSWDQFIRQKA